MAVKLEFDAEQMKEIMDAIESLNETYEELKKDFVDFKKEMSKGSLVYSSGK